MLPILNKHVNYKSVILQKDLRNKAFNKQKSHGLTNKNIANRVTRSRLLQKTHAGHNMIFSDEKLFTLDAPLNKQNDRVYEASSSPKGKLALLFIDEVVKIN